MLELGLAGCRTRARIARHARAAVQREQPNAVAAFRTGEERARRERDHILLAPMLERRHGRVDARVRLELPEQMAVHFVERR